MTNDHNQLDPERIGNLIDQISLAIRNHYVRGPTSRDRTFEALNALAYVTATILAGTDDQTARLFFDKALSMSLETIKAECN